MDDRAFGCIFPLLVAATLGIALLAVYAFIHLDVAERSCNAQHGVLVRQAGGGHVCIEKGQH